MAAPKYLVYWLVVKFRREANLIQEPRRHAFETFKDIGGSFRQVDGPIE